MKILLLALALVLVTPFYAFDAREVKSTTKQVADKKAAIRAKLMKAHIEDVKEEIQELAEEGKSEYRFNYYITLYEGVSFLALNEPLSLAETKVVAKRTHNTNGWYYFYGFTHKDKLIFNDYFTSRGFRIERNSGYYSYKIVWREE